MKRFALIALILAGCAQEGHPDITIKNLNARFDGHNADEFFLSYGMPAGEHTLNSGGKIYRWVSGVDNYLIPATPAPYLPGRHWDPVLADTYPSSVSLEFCEIQIHTTMAGIIQSLTMTRDAIGHWSTSRCSEIFDTPGAPAP